MNIALIGYGKMGQTIERIAIKREHTIVLKITSKNVDMLNAASLKNVDVAIEFSKPEVAFANVMQCIEAGVNVVCGTTGWNKDLPNAEQNAIEKKCAFLQASNFSIGVNLFFEINKHLAHLMNNHIEYAVSIEETHHTHKKDAPSGTAITLAEQILNTISSKKTWHLGNSEDKNSIPIIANRIENVPGTHNVKYTSPIDDIEIIHTAHNRDGFALGAVLAAEFIKGKQGIFKMKDVLGI